MVSNDTLKQRIQGVILSHMSKNLGEEEVNKLKTQLVSNDKIAQQKLLNYLQANYESLSQDISLVYTVTKESDDI